MTITLTEALAKLVNEKVRSGAYKSADEVITASLRLLKAKEEGTEALRRELLRGLADIEQGRFSAHTTEDGLEAFSDDVVRRARERRDTSRGR